jgi:FKBP-type peptidyl-prolyl cis-trans isomerase
MRTHYHAVTDGTVFDGSSSAVVNRQVSGSNGVICPGWTEALQMMPVGSSGASACPYGLRRARLPVVPLFASLVFDVELLDILD